LPWPSLMQIAAFYWHGVPLPYHPRVQASTTSPLLFHCSESASPSARLVEIIGTTVPAARREELIEAIAKAPEVDEQLVNDCTAAMLKLKLDSRPGLRLRVGPALTACLRVVLAESSATVASLVEPVVVEMPRTVDSPDPAPDVWWLDNVWHQHRDCISLKDARERGRLVRSGSLRQAELGSRGPLQRCTPCGPRSELRSQTLVKAGGRCTYCRSSNVTVVVSRAPSTRFRQTYAWEDDGSPSAECIDCGRFSDGQIDGYEC
jgi:hypothetical protein